MVALSRGLFPLLVALSSFACDPEVTRVPATQTVVRLEAAPEVRAALRSLRIRTAAPEGSTWGQRNDRTFSADVLRWPVEIVVVPSSEGESSKPFELIADAVDANGDVLAQVRGLTGFVRREQRLLVLQLAACGARPLGFVCEDDPTCLGPTCTTCVDARCTETPMVPPADLAIFEPGSLGDGAVDDEMDGGQREPDAEAGPRDADTDTGREGSAPPGCDPGSELDDAGRCLDINECARGLDDCADDPQACVNLDNGLGFSCACPTGYRGDGRGAGGCADIDECMEETDSCDALAECNNKLGGYACGDCPAGYTPGTGGTCVDLDECATNNGGCDMDPMADCMNLVGMPNTCDCRDGYTGNGVGSAGCVDENECNANNGGCDTDPMARCNNQAGAPRTCTCPDGSSGSGIGPSGCTDVVDCMAGSCQHNGRCIEGVQGFTCDCSGTGYNGTTCQVDPCTPNPCGTGFDCSRTTGPTATASCSASCTRPGAGGCQPGDACVTDADCRIGGDSSATCDATDKVCVQVCGTISIVSQENLDAARYCREINGDLIIEPNFATIPATALPYLTRVRGAVKSGSASGNSAAQSITLGRLETVDGELGFGGFQNLTLASFPRLTSTGGISFILGTLLARISLPQLTRVQGGFALGVLHNLTQVDAGRLNSISGSVNLTILCKLPWSQVERIAALGTSQTVNTVGCCTMFSKHSSCNGGTGNCTCTP